MENDALLSFAENTRTLFGPLTHRVAEGIRSELEKLTKASPSEPWLAALHEGAPASKELLRDADRGYVLLAHTEPPGLYRPPHDHGRGWVVYALQRGEMRISTYARVEDDEGRIRLVKRDSSLLRAGEARVYWPGDIHDTRCGSEPSLLFRFTDRDLKKEDLEAHRVRRYPEPEHVCALRTAP